MVCARQCLSGDLNDKRQHIAFVCGAGTACRDQLDCPHPYIRGCRDPVQCEGHLEDGCKDWRACFPPSPRPLHAQDCRERLRLPRLPCMAQGQFRWRPYRTVRQDRAEGRAGHRDQTDRRCPVLPSRWNSLKPAVEFLMPASLQTCCANTARLRSSPPQADCDRALPKASTKRGSTRPFMPSRVSIASAELMAGL